MNKFALGILTLFCGVCTTGARATDMSGVGYSLQVFEDFVEITFRERATGATMLAEVPTDAAWITRTGNSATLTSLGDDVLKMKVAQIAEAAAASNGRGRLAFAITRRGCASAFSVGSRLMYRVVTVGSTVFRANPLLSIIEISVAIGGVIFWLSFPNTMQAATSDPDWLAVAAMSRTVEGRASGGPAENCGACYQMVWAKAGGTPTNVWDRVKADCAMAGGGFRVAECRQYFAAVSASLTNCFYKGGGRGSVPVASRPPAPAPILNASEADARPCSAYCSSTCN